MSPGHHFIPVSLFLVLYPFPSLNPPRRRPSHHQRQHPPKSFTSSTYNSFVCRCFLYYPSLFSLFTYNIYQIPKLLVMLTRQPIGLAAAAAALSILPTSLAQTAGSIVDGGNTLVSAMMVCLFSLVPNQPRR